MNCPMCGQRMDCVLVKGNFQTRVLPPEHDLDDDIRVIEEADPADVEIIISEITKPVFRYVCPLTTCRYSEWHDERVEG